MAVRRDIHPARPPLVLLTAPPDGPARAVATYLLGLDPADLAANADGGPATMRAIAAACGISERTAYRHVDALVACGWLAKTSRPGYAVGLKITGAQSNPCHGSPLTPDNAKVKEPRKRRRQPALPLTPDTLAIATTEPALPLTPDSVTPDSVRGINVESLTVNLDKGISEEHPLTANTAETSFVDVAGATPPVTPPKGGKWLPFYTALDEAGVKAFNAKGAPNAAAGNIARLVSQHTTDVHNVELAVALLGAFVTYRADEPITATNFQPTFTAWERGGRQKRRRPRVDPRPPLKPTGTDWSRDPTGGW